MTTVTRVEPWTACDRCGHTSARHFISQATRKDGVKLASACTISGCLCDDFWPAQPKETR